jgi:hypothetical protein
MHNIISKTALFYIGRPGPQTIEMLQNGRGTSELLRLLFVITIAEGKRTLISQRL